MVTNRLYLGIPGVSLAFVVLLALVVSGGDLAFVAFFTKVAGGTVLVICASGLPFAWHANGWQRAPAEALAQRIGGRVVSTLGGDLHVRVDEPDGSATVVYWEALAEVMGDDDYRYALPFTWVGRQRPGRRPPGVELRLFPSGERQLRWGTAYRRAYTRKPAPDPLVTPEARAAADTLAALDPSDERRIRYDRDVVAFGVLGTRTDTDALAELVAQARGPLGTL